MTTAATIQITQEHANHAGARYEGEVSIATSHREGHGKYFYPNPYFVYEGEWLGGEKHGRGRLSLGQGGYYEGNFERGEIMGEGSQTWADGSTYSGQFFEGVKHGEGTYERTNGLQYSGSWEHNRYSGEGELTLPTGDTYKGNFQKHKYHGEGNLVESSLERQYTGSFESGAFHGHGELHEQGGAFIYTGQFTRGRKYGQGKGSDVSSGISYTGDWEEDLPVHVAASWDLAVPQGDSYVTFSERLREEAAAQLTNLDPKKDKKKPDAKKAASPEPDAGPIGPELDLTVGENLPEVSLRVRNAKAEPMTQESGRCFRITMYKERRIPSEADPNEMEVIRRPVNFGDKRKTFVDPLDPVEEVKPGKDAKNAKAPTPQPEEDEDKEEPDPGEEAREGVLGSTGDFIFGNAEEWLVPVHLQPAIYWLCIEDITELRPGSFFKLLEPLEMPVRVKERAVSK